MNDLVIEKNHEAVCTSLQIAEKFEKQHKHVLEKIEKILADSSAEFSAQCFKRSSYKDDTGKSNKMYYINRDGFTFLVMGFTGKKANEWKWQYIKAFNQMESIISEQRTPMFIEERTQNKVIRLAETDTIKEFVEYARSQGSKNAEKYYSNYTKMSNKAVGIESVKYATTIQLSRLTLIENIIANQIRVGMEQKKYYKDIFKDCKKQIETFKTVAYLD